MNIQNAESAVAISPATETMVDSGDSSKNVASVREAIGDAKKRMFGDAKPEVQGKVETDAVESKGEEPVIEEDNSNENKTQRNDEGRDRAREKDKKQISKLTAQKYALKEENSRLQAEIEKFKQKMANEPQREDFNDDQAYNRAKIRYDMELENGVERFQVAEKELVEKRNTEWTDRCKSTVKDYNKFAENYSNNYKLLNANEKEMMHFVSQSIVGPKILEAAFNNMFKDADKYAAWRGLSKEGKLSELVAIESEYMHELSGNQRNNVPTKKSNAPTPIAPEKASDKVAPKAVSVKDQIAKSKAKMFGY